MVSFTDITLKKNEWADLTDLTDAATGGSMIVTNVSTGGGEVVRVEDATVEPPTGPIRNGPSFGQNGFVTSKPVAGDSVFATSLLGDARISVQVLL